MSAAPEPNLPIWVQQENGTRTPLDSKRLWEDLASAVEKAGQADPMLGQEVLEVVYLAAKSRLERRVAQGEASPSLRFGELGDLVEQALVQMGQTAIAKAYILQRDQRHRARTALRTGPEGGSHDAAGATPVVRDGSGTTDWDAARVAAALVREAELPQEIAQEVAYRVERRVLDAGLRRLTSSLVRAFVDNELGAMGLGDALARQRPVGVPRHDLRDWIRAGDAATEGGLLRKVGGDVLRRFAVDDLLDAEGADAQQRGDLHLHNLEAPHRPLHLGLPAELLLRGQASKHAPTQLLQAVAPLLQRVGHSVTLESLEPVFADLGRGARAMDAVQDFLAAGGAVAQAANRDLHLCHPGGRGGRWAQVLLSGATELWRQGLACPTLWLDASEVEGALKRDPELADGVDGLLGAGRLVGVWHGGGDRYVGPGLRRRGRERGALACGGSIALNLPRLAREAGPWREERFLEQTAKALRFGVGMLGSLATFQSATHNMAGLAQPRTTYALAPVGLLEALRILGDGEIRADQGARILGFLAEAVVRFGREDRLSVHLDAALGLAAARRFAALDRAQKTGAQGRLFEDLPTPERDSVECYSTGYLPDRWARASTEPAAAANTEATAAYLARLLVGVRCGALTGPIEAASGPARGETRGQGQQLALWNRFVTFQTEHLDSGPVPPQKGAEALPQIPLFDSTG